MVEDTPSGGTQHDLDVALQWAERLNKRGREKTDEVLAKGGRKRARLEALATETSHAKPS